LDHVSPVKHPTTNVATRNAGAASILRRGTRGLHGNTAHTAARTPIASETSTTPNARSVAVR
jgi:hypothetical protein